MGGGNELFLSGPEIFVSYYGILSWGRLHDDTYARGYAVNSNSFVFVFPCLLVEEWTRFYNTPVNYRGQKSAFTLGIPRVA